MALSPPFLAPRAWKRSTKERWDIHGLLSQQSNCNLSVGPSYQLERTFGCMFHRGMTKREHQALLCARLVSLTPFCKLTWTSASRVVWSTLKTSQSNSSKVQVGGTVL